MTILVTGGTGLIGARVTNRLVGSGHKVVCADCAPNRQRLADIDDSSLLELVELDVTDAGNVESVIKEQSIDRIVHLAALMIPVTEEEPAKGFSVNVGGTNNMFEAARKCSVTRVVYPSSIGVYGDQDEYGDTAIDEDTPVKPNSLYGHHKHMHEVVGKAYSERFGVDSRGLRVCTVFGHGRTAGRSAEISKVISVAAQGGKEEFSISRDQISPLIFVEDVAETLVRLVLGNNLHHPVYVSSAYRVTMGEIIDIVNEYLPENPVSFNGAEIRIPHVNNINSTRIESDIEYRLPPLRERIRDHINCAREEVGLPVVGL